MSAVSREGGRDPCQAAKSIEPDGEQLMASFAHGQGFELCLYQAHAYPPMTRPTVIRAGNAPPAWLEAYARQELAAQDPWMRHAQAHCHPWLWAAAEQRAPACFWHAAQQQGMHHGCTLPMRTEHGIIGAMTFTRGEGPLSPDEFEPKCAELQGFCRELHEQLLERRLPRCLRRPDQPLSERERTILRWTADGKTAAEIAMILGLTKRTIDFHVAKATMKLDTSNKTQAALKAAVLGLLF